MQIIRSCWRIIECFVVWRCKYISLFFEISSFTIIPKIDITGWKSVPTGVTSLFKEIKVRAMNFVCFSSSIIVIDRSILKANIATSCSYAWRIGRWICITFISNRILKDRISTEKALIFLVDRTISGKSSRQAIRQTYYCKRLINRP